MVHLRIWRADAGFHLCQRIQQHAFSPLDSPTVRWDGL